MYDYCQFTDRGHEDEEAPAMKTTTTAAELDYTPAPEVRFENWMVYSNGNGYAVKVDQRGRVATGRTARGAVKSLAASYREERDARKARGLDSSYFEACLNACKLWLKEDAARAKPLPLVINCPDCGKLVSTRFLMHDCIS